MFKLSDTIYEVRMEVIDENMSMMTVINACDGFGRSMHPPKHWPEQGSWTVEKDGDHCHFVMAIRDGQNPEDVALKHGFELTEGGAIKVLCKVFHNNDDNDPISA